ncbi:MAG: GntR family transcriptional regulator [Candidatus Thiodiazotropha sp. (ex Cardiolucina cf. quadrata)]|nr:GntR family transcriptional regulator [Candidatus Thiodiazotropha sp. (ex Cardiolucina cf. quadrata)]
MDQKQITDKLQDLKSQSLSKVVEEQLELMILRGDLQPGDRINESYLSNLLQISRAPIREACRNLSQYGVVETRVGKGTFVRQVNLKEAVELYDIRGILDALAAEQASQLADPEGFSVLANLIEQMRDLADNKASTEYFTTNLAFHLQIVRLAGNSALIDIYEVIIKKLSLFRQITLSQPDRLQRSLSQHENILDAIKNRNASRAGQLARDHVEEAKEVLVDKTEVKRESA